MEYLWELPDPLPSLPTLKKVPFHPIITSLIYRRFPEVLEKEENLHSFLHPEITSFPDPFSFSSMKKGVDLLFEGIREGLPMGIFGDYDVDGITGTAILSYFFSEIGISVKTYLPLREEGYGIQEKAVEKIHRDGVKILILVDNGITAHRAIKKALDLGMKVVVLDHHLPEETFPSATVILHPSFSTDPSFRYLCGAGLAFTFLLALRSHLVREGYCKEKKVKLIFPLILAGIGTLADMVPLMGANRIVVRESLKRLKALLSIPEEKVAWPFLGIRALLSVSGIRKETLTEEAVQFYLAPRLNAAGRMESARISLDLLLTSSLEVAQKNAQLVDRLNRNRQKWEDQIVEAILKIYTPLPPPEKMPVLMEFHPQWPPGVLGIVAQRIVRHFYRPTVLFHLDGNGILKGSARGIREVHLLELLRAGKEETISLGGHKEACGLTLPFSSLFRFREKVWSAGRTLLTKGNWVPRLFLDGDLPTYELNRSFVKELSLLAPFGTGNPRPIFRSETILPERVDLIQERHLVVRFRTKGRFQRAIAFRKKEWKGRVGGPIRLAYSISPSEEEGFLTIEDLKSTLL